MHRWGSTRCKAVKNVVNCRVRLNLKSEKGRKKAKLGEMKEETPDVGRVGSDCVPKFLQGKQGKVKSWGNVFWELQRGWIRDGVFWRYILPRRFICQGKLEAHPTKAPSHLCCLVLRLKQGSRQVPWKAEMLPGPADHAGLCRVMAGRAGMTLFPTDGCEPAPLPWWWYPRVGRFQAAPEMKGAEGSPLAFSTALCPEWRWK